MIDEKIKKMYDWVLENIAKKPENEAKYDILFYPPDFTKRANKIVNGEKMIFGYELNESANEQDYYEYILFVLEFTDYTLNDIENLIIV